MFVHVPTLFFMTCGIALLVAVKMVVTAVRAPGAAPWLLWWAAGFAATGISSLLSTLRFAGYEWIAIAASNALLFAAYAMIWKGCAAFAGRPLGLPAMLAGPALWLAFLAATAFSATMEWRVVVGSALIALYSGATARELLRIRPSLDTARQAGILFLLHAGLYLVRMGTAFLDGAIADGSNLTGYTFTVVIFEGVLFAVAVGYLLLAMLREQSELVLRAASHTDYLTGVHNRRAFTLEAEPLAAGPRRVAVILFDIDHFKRINDKHGHGFGDEVLKHFCRLAESRLGRNDLFARLGGEEFVALLPGVEEDGAATVGEAIVQLFAVETRGFRGAPVYATVSAGVAASAGETSLDRLLARADLALYAAKSRGRNRLEVAGPLDEAMAEGVAAVRRNGRLNSQPG